MLNKKIIAGLLLTLVAAASIADSADAKRRCPRGYEDINDICYPKPGS